MKKYLIRDKAGKDYLKSILVTGLILSLILAAGILYMLYVIHSE